MRPIDCEAIVLAAMDYGETDRIITYFTREHGKVRCIARHGKKSVKRFGAALEVFARVRLDLVLKEGLSNLRNADLITVFPGIRADLGKIGYAGYACELTDRLLPEGLVNLRLYRLLASYLEYLDVSPALADDRRFFEVNLLNILGYRLPLDQCSRCGALLGDASVTTYDPPSGGLCCRLCCRSGHTIGPSTVDLLRKSMATGRFGSIRFAAEALREAGIILDFAIASHLNHPLKSLAFLQKVLGLY